MTIIAIINITANTLNAINRLFDDGLSLSKNKKIADATSSIPVIAATQGNALTSCSNSNKNFSFVEILNAPDKKFLNPASVNAKPSVHTTLINAKHITNKNITIQSKPVIAAAKHKINPNIPMLNSMAPRCPIILRLT